MREAVAGRSANAGDWSGGGIVLICVKPLFTTPTVPTAVDCLIDLLTLAQESPTRMWDQLDELTRTRIKMALVALLILMAACFVMVRLGGRWVRRLGKEDNIAPRRREPRPFLKPLSDEEARLAVPIIGNNDEAGDGDTDDTSEEKP